MLGNIRKPYLNVDVRSAPPLTRQASRGAADLGQSWAGIRFLTNEERDQIDTQARVILGRCADRVKEMEALESRADRSRLPTTAPHSFYISRACRACCTQRKPACALAPRAAGARPRRHRRL
jgi:hypothetical protein